MQKPRFRTRIAAISLAALTAACGSGPASLAPLTAQPDARPARNFTSFSGALRCMDQKLARSSRRRVLLSSTDIPDKTKKISIGADDMLINAIGHMNRTSRKYIFLDQGLVRDGGLIDLQIADRNPARPNFYIRGSISQLDSNVLQEEMGLDFDSNLTGGLLSAGLSRGRAVSIVSVDLHLVAYPSRQVVPGMSVANSMAVVARGGGGEAKGTINLADLNLWLEIERVESNSQAVRNLIELGVIELLGRHSGLPYWECLSHPGVQTGPQKTQERAHHARPASAQLSEAQELLRRLGHLDAPADGRMTEATRAAIARFQEKEGLIADGEVDFDLIARLRERVATLPAPAAPVKAVSKPALKKQRKLAPAAAPANDGYENLYHLLK